MFTVTADFLKYLRKAKSVYMHTKDGETAHIRLSKENSYSRPSRGDFEMYYNVRVGSDYRKEPEFYFNTMYIEGSGWDIFRKVLHVGDELRFRARENNNQYVERCTAYHHDDHGVVRETYKGMHHDQLCVDIYRRNKPFLRDVVLDDSICPDNSARSITPTRNR